MQQVGVDGKYLSFCGGQSDGDQCGVEEELELSGELFDMSADEGREEIRDDVEEEKERMEVGLGVSLNFAQHGCRLKNILISCMHFTPLTGFCQRSTLH